MLIQGNIAGSSRTFQFSSPVSNDALSEILVSALELYREVTPRVLLWDEWGIWGKPRVRLSLNLFFVCLMYWPDSRHVWREDRKHAQRGIEVNRNKMVMDIYTTKPR